MDAGDLESAIASAKNSNAPEKEKIIVPKEEELGFHKGALNVLASERAELVKMLQNVEAIAGMHIKRLKELSGDDSSNSGALKK